MMKPAKLLAAVGLSLGLAVPALAEDLIVYVSPDVIGVNPFLQMGKTGIEAAAAKIGATSATYEGAGPDARKENVLAAINEGASIVVVLGFEFNDIIIELAPTAPEVQFLIVDQCIESQPDNVHCAVFREHEAAYLVGIEAGLLSTGKLGAVGALDIPFMHRFTDGFAAGVMASNPAATVDVRWVGGDNPFGDPVRAKEQAVAINGAGADVIFAATSGGDFGIFEAAKAAGFKVASVDVNHCPEVPGQMVDVMLKRVDNAIVQAVETIKSGAVHSFASYGLKEGGMTVMGIEPDLIADSGCMVADHPEVAAAAQAAAARIIDGSLVLEDPLFAK